MEEAMAIVVVTTTLLMFVAMVVNYSLGQTKFKILSSVGDIMFGLIYGATILLLNARNPSWGVLSFPTGLYLAGVIASWGFLFTFLEKRRIPWMAEARIVFIGTIGVAFVTGMIYTLIPDLDVAPFPNWTTPMKGRFDMEKLFLPIEIALIVLTLGSLIVASVFYALRNKEAKWLPGWQLKTEGDQLGIWIRRLSWLATIALALLALMVPHWIGNLTLVVPSIGVFIIALVIIIAISLHDNTSHFQDVVRAMAVTTVVIFVILMLLSFAEFMGIDIWAWYEALGEWVATPGVLTYAPQVTMILWFTLFGVGISSAFNEDTKGVWAFIVYDALCVYPLFVAATWLGIVAVVLLALALFIGWVIGS